LHTNWHIKVWKIAAIMPPFVLFVAEHLSFDAN